MFSFGIYDSGIGGLTTLVPLKRAFETADFCFLADTGNNPLGTKTKGEIVKAVGESLEILKRESLCQVVACNTASTIVKPKGCFLLRPFLEELPPESTLLLCTPATSKALKLDEKGYKTADTRNLATAVEILCETAFKNKDITVINHIENHLKLLLDSHIKTEKIDTIYLGCSHYLYFKAIIKKLYPFTTILDGNDRLIKEIKSSGFNPNSVGKITFDFTLGNQCEKYAWLVEQLDKNKDFFDI